MDCVCSYDDSPTLFDERIQKARKNHKCSECHTIIKKNEYYERMRSLYDGDWYTYKHCMKCSEAFAIAEQAGMCPLYEGLMECISEVFCDIDDKYQEYFKKVVPHFVPDYWFDEI